MNITACIGAVTGRTLAAIPKVTAITAVATLAAFGSSAQAAIFYSGPVNIVVPDNIDGVYLNLVTGASGTVAGAVPGWDINPYSAVAGGFHLWGATTTTWFNTAGVIGSAGGYLLADGTTIGPGANFFRPGGGTNLAESVTLNAPNLFGVQFTNEPGGTNHFGWVEITFGATAASRAITGWAFESTPNAAIQAGVIPEPGTYALMLAGLAGIAGFAARRRKAD
jgi:hypothetical protein